MRKKLITYHYFKTKPERYEYLGNRYFRVCYDHDSVLQVCLSSGDVKKGKANNFGTYLIAKMTFFSNYLAQSYVEPCTQRQFEKQFNLMIKMLK